jgi:hypothetical protein
MKRSGLFILALILTLSLGYVNLSAANGQEYSMNKALCAKYVKLSREAVEEDNLPMAQAYAKKAIQANSWEMLAWANYNDIIQRLADDGEIPDFGTVLEESQADQGPSSDEGPAQLEGC